MWGKTKAMRISRNPLSLQIAIDSKPENVEHFNYIGSVVITGARYTHEIKSRIAVVKTTFNKKAHLASELDLNLRNNLVDCYMWSITLYGAGTWTHQKVDQKYPKFWNVVLEKDGENQLDPSCEELKRIALIQEQWNVLLKIKGRKANRIGHIFCRSCRLKHVIEGKVEGSIQVRGRRERRRKQILDDLKEKRV